MPDLRGSSPGRRGRRRDAGRSRDKKTWTGVVRTLTVLVAAALIVSAASTGATKDPLSLVLQRSDFPAKTKWRAARYASVDKSLAAAGFKAKSADYSAEIPRGPTETLFVSGRVVVLASAAEARRLFAQYRRDIALDLKLARAVRLPAYGDEQSAFTQTNPGVRADLRVRTGATVWRVEVRWGGVEKLTVAQALKELRTYATKLQRRVGRG
jgi:hypothetical protein